MWSLFSLEEEMIMYMFFEDFWQYWTFCGTKLIYCWQSAPLGHLGAWNGEVNNECPEWRFWVVSAQGDVTIGTDTTRLTSVAEHNRWLTSGGNPEMHFSTKGYKGSAFVHWAAVMMRIDGDFYVLSEQLALAESPIKRFYWISVKSPKTSAGNDP